MCASKENCSKDICVRSGSNRPRTFRKKTTKSFLDNRINFPMKNEQDNKTQPLQWVDEGYWIRKAEEEAMLEFENTPFPETKENVAIITFGQETKILHHPTCNYEEPRHCLDNIICRGPSPLLSSLLLCIGVFKGGSEANVYRIRVNIAYRTLARSVTFRSNGWVLRPRIIVISDGRATDSCCLDGPENRYFYNLERVNSELYSWAERLHHKIYCVPVGDADTEVLSILSAISNGSIVKMSEVRTQLGRYYPNLSCAETISRGNMSFDWDKVSINDLKRSWEAYAPFGMGRTKEDYEAMKEMLVKGTSDNEDNNENDDELDIENPEMPPIGSRVRRGPDWRWGNQDDCGVGTVSVHQKDGWCRVIWDQGPSYPYRYGVNGIDLVIVDEPRILDHKYHICVGSLVTRGPDWKWGDQDGGKGSTGIVYMINRGEIYVKWPNGHRGNYRFNLNGHFDVQLSEDNVFENHPRKISKGKSLRDGENFAKGNLLNDR